MITRINLRSYPKQVFGSNKANLCEIFWHQTLQSSISKLNKFFNLGINLTLVLNYLNQQGVNCQFDFLIVNLQSRKIGKNKDNLLTPHLFLYYIYSCNYLMLNKLNIFAIKPRQSTWFVLYAYNLLNSN